MGAGRAPGSLHEPSSSGSKTLAILGALGARRVPRERVRGLSALRLVERSGTEITVVKRRPRQRALRNVPRQPEQYPYDAPTWEASDSEGHVYIVELTS